MRSVKLALCVWLLTLNLSFGASPFVVGYSPSAPVVRRFARTGISPVLPFYIKWEQRTTGNDNNGGGFDPGTSSGGLNGSGCTGGTDRSQSDTPFVAFDGVTIAATTAGVTNVIVITGYTPVTADKCNVLQITGGVNFITGFYAISASAGGTWTLDRNATTGAASAMTGNMGGALLTYGKLFSAIVSGSSTSRGMRAWQKNGTYTQTAAAALSGTVNDFVIEGYQTTRGDLGTPPLVTTATNSTKLVTFGSSTALYGVKFKNINWSNTATTRDIGIFASTGGGANTLECEMCKFTGFTQAINGCFDGSGVFYWNAIYIRQSEFTGNTVAGVCSAGNLYVEGTNFHDQLAPAITMKGAPAVLSSLQAHKNVFDTLGTGTTTLANAIRADVADTHFSYTIRGNSFYNITGSCLLINQGLNSFDFSGNICEAATRYTVENVGTNGAGDLGAVISKNNATFNNTIGTYLGWPADSSDIALTASPYVNAAGKNFALNTTSGGGAAVRAACFPGVIPAAGTGFLDCGALQSQSSAGGGNSAYAQ